ncbi:hypothetical protein [Streptomyces sp. NPDC048445]|uniref:hypothetical protein n=1 Tax=Streptomyces sp. NPDC048445 TaxID=3365553 RepID=UPI0037178606
MTITRALRRAAAVALLAVLPVLAVSAGGVVQSDHAAVVADPGWGAAGVTDPPAEPERTDPGWG